MQHRDTASRPRTRPRPDTGPAAPAAPPSEAEQTTLPGGSDASGPGEGLPAGPGRSGSGEGLPGGSVGSGPGEVLPAGSGPSGPAERLPGGPGPSGPGEVLPAGSLPGGSPADSGLPGEGPRGAERRRGGVSHEDQPRHSAPPEVLSRELLAPYLHAQATYFLRSLRLHRESGQDAQGAADAVEAARALRSSARRISATLHTFRPLIDTGWADTLRSELGWLSGTLAREHAYAARLNRLLEALNRLSGGGDASPAPVPPARGSGTEAAGSLTVGAARAGALLERQLTLARTRAHSAALQALGSSRFHAVADAVALLASDVPLGPAAAAPAAEVLAPLATGAEQRLREAVAALPLGRASHPYNAEALVHGLAAAPSSEAQDAPWHHVRLLLRLHRYAQEVVTARTDTAPTGKVPASQALDHHRDASEAAAAAASAARTPRIAPATAYALGVLHADQRHEVEAARFAFQQVWQPATAAAP